MKKQVLILIGPKGAGKTTLGSLIEEEFGIYFLKVEPLLLQYIETHDLHSQSLPRHGFDIEEEAIDKLLKTHGSLIFESTGSSEFFPSMLQNLKQKYDVKLIKINCSPQICLNRVKRRPNEGHFIVSDEQTQAINDKASSLVLEWDLELDNSGQGSFDTLLNCFSQFILMQKVKP